MKVFLQTDSKLILIGQATHYHLKCKWKGERELIMDSVENFPTQLGRGFIAGTLILTTDKSTQKLEGALFFQRDTNSIRYRPTTLAHLGEAVTLVKAVAYLWPKKVIQVIHDEWDYTIPGIYLCFLISSGLLSSNTWHTIGMVGVFGVLVYMATAVTLGLISSIAETITMNCLYLFREWCSPEDNLGRELSALDARLSIPYALIFCTTVVLFKFFAIRLFNMGTVSTLLDATCYLIAANALYGIYHKATLFMDRLENTRELNKVLSHQGVKIKPRNEAGAFVWFTLLYVALCIPCQ